MADPLDLWGSWREALQKWEQDTNAALTAATGDQRFSQAMNQSLSVFARLQAKQAEAMDTALSRANLPSRADFRHIDARLDAIEQQIASLTELVRRGAPAAGPIAADRTPNQPAKAAVVAGPPRTRKPPAAAEPAPGESGAAASPKGKAKPTEGASA